MIKRPDTNAQRLKRHKRVRAKLSGTPAVSYTHLDVYKRQAQGRAYRINKRTSHVTLAVAERD